MLLANAMRVAPCTRLPRKARFQPPISIPDTFQGTAIIARGLPPYFEN